MSAPERPWAGRRMHFVGVGGAGMSGYARAAHALGATVTGSDQAESPYLASLREEGVLDAAIGHDRANLPSGERLELVYSSAVAEDNPERAAARERGVPEMPRARLLGELSARRRTIAVAGTHGKTTTAAMIAHVMVAAGMDPGWLIGASPAAGLANSRWSAGEWLIIEADESDRSMLSLNMEIAVLTNVELEHHAAFSSLEQLREAFAAFLARAERAIVVWDRPELVALKPHGDERSLLAYEVQRPELLAGGSRFRWRGHAVQLSVPGLHNAINATGALEAARLAGAPPAASAQSLRHFAGAERRFQRLGASERGALLVDDYAHHPTEVEATLRAARTLGAGRLVAVFQPHLYSRTALMAAQFGTALALADVVVVLDVYAARERAEDHPGVSGLAIARAAADACQGRPVLWMPRLAEAEPVLRGMLRDGDLCLVMGAGDVSTLARSLVAR